MTFSIIHEGLLQDILENPEDDTPRLILADWLQDNGDPDRAEFIRVQVELEKHPWAEHVRDDRYDARDGIDSGWRDAFELHGREQKLLWKYEKGLGHNWERWCWAEARDEEGAPCRPDYRGSYTVTPHGSPGLGGNSCGCVVDTMAGLVGQSFRRGFVERIDCLRKTWLANGPKIVGGCPVLRVRLKDARPHSSHGRFWWHKLESTDPPSIGVLWHFLPANIHLHLSGTFVNEGYASVEEAYQDLSEACLKWAKEANGHGD